MPTARMIAPKRRAGIAAPQKKPSAKKRRSRYVERAPQAKQISPIDLMHGVIAALNDCGIFFHLAQATEDRFTFHWQSVPDDRHHATIRLQAGPDWFYCRIFFAPLSSLLDTDLILLEMERELQGQCGFEIERSATSTMTHRRMDDMTAAGVALTIFSRLSAYVVGRARCEIYAEKMRQEARQIARDALTIGMPVVGDEDDR